MEIAWDYEGRYVGEGHRGDLDKTRAIRRRRLATDRAHHCLTPHAFKRLGIDSRSLTIAPSPEGCAPENRHDGCGVFICSTCKRPTPWCMGMSESTECDYCAPTGDDE